MGHIYKITNDINEKIYIGKTVFSIEKRFKEHCRDSQKQELNNRLLYNAMKKYGIEHFSISEIEECDNNVLANREQYWINFYNSYENGYNATLGGDGKILYDHDAILLRLMECPYPKEIAREFNCSVDIVREIGHLHNINLKNHGQEKLKESSKTIYQYTKDNKLLNIFSSTVEAAEWCFNNQKCKTLNSGVRSHIAECANEKRKSAYGYIWKY